MYISNAIILESNKQGTAGWVLRSGSLEDRHTLYNDVVDLIIDLSNQKRSINDVYDKVINQFGSHDLFNSSRFNYRSVQNLKTKFRDRTSINMQKGPRNLRFPDWVLKSGSLEDRHTLYNDVVDLIIDLSNQRKSREEVYNTVVDRFGNNDLFDLSRFSINKINNLKIKHSDRVTVNMRKGPRDYDHAPANWVLKSGSLEDRRTLYNDVLDLVISMSNQRKSIEEVYNAVVDRFGNNDLFDLSRFNYRSVQYLKSKFSDRVTVNMQKGPRDYRPAPANWVLRSGSLEDRRTLYNDVVDLVIDLSNQRKSIEEVYGAVVDRFGNNDLFDLSRFNYRSVQNLKSKFSDRVTVNMQKGSRNLKFPGWVLRSGSLEDRHALYNSVVDLIINLTKQGEKPQTIYNFVINQFGNNDLFDSSRFTKNGIYRIKNKS